MTRILVTGATGFVGRPLVGKLSATGHEVRAVARRSPSPPLPAGVSVAIQPDLARKVDWDPLLAGVDAIVHLAGIAHTSRDIPPSEYNRINHLATAELAGAANRAGVKRFVFISSVRAQSGPAADHVLTEKDNPKPSDAYGRSKLAAELAVAAAGVPFAILRPVLIYGPGVKGNLAMLARLAALPIPLPFGAFDNRRSLLSVDNFIRAITFVLETPRTAGETYLVADPEPISLADIIASLRRGLGRRPGLVAVPPMLLRIFAQIAGGSDLWSRLGGDLVADPAKLIAAGWSPAAATLAEFGRGVKS